MVDFVEEVEERLRAERYSRLVQTYLPWFVAALVATVIGWLGVWGFDTWRDRNVAAASQAYDKASTALVAGDQVSAFNDLKATAKDGPAGYRTLALMQQANIRLAGGKPAEAVALFDSAAKAAPTPIFKDLASLRAAQAMMDTAPYAQIQARLKPLADDKRPFSLLAKEMLALAKLQAGNVQEARGDFNALSLTLGVTPGMRERAQAAIALIDSGQASLVGKVVSVAVTSPPSPGGMTSGLSGAQAPATDANPQDSGEPSAPESSQPPAGNDQ